MRIENLEKMRLRPLPFQQLARFSLRRPSRLAPAVVVEDLECLLTSRTPSTTTWPPFKLPRRCRPQQLPPTTEDSQQPRRRRQLLLQPTVTCHPVRRHSAGLFVDLILSCWLFRIKDSCRKSAFSANTQTRVCGSLMRSWDPCA